MSSDEELNDLDNRPRRSLTSPVPPSAGGGGPESPKFDNINDPDKIGSVNEITLTTPNEVANSDERVKQVLYSDIGLSVLLNRIKQDVATCKELATIFKKRAIIEDEHGKSLQKLAKITQDTLKRSDIKQQGFNRQFLQTIRAWETSTASSINFSYQLHTMVDEITELGKAVDRKRKIFKHEALRDEMNVTAAEGIAEKARNKRDSLRADLERTLSALRGETLPPQKGRFGIPRKSGTQLIKHEEELRMKMVEADRDMHSKGQVVYDVRRDLMNNLRPRNVRNLVDLITEIDSGLSFYLQKFAVLSETLAVNHGNAMLPAAAGRQGFSALIEQINDGRDFRDYVLEFSGKIPRINRYSDTMNTDVPTASSGPARVAPPQLPEGNIEVSGYGRGAPPQLPEVETQFTRGELNQDVQRAVPGSSSSSRPVLPLNFPHSPTQPSQITFPPSNPPQTYPGPNRGSGSPSSSNLPATSSAQPPAPYASNQPASQVPSTYLDPPANLSASNLTSQRQPMSSIQPTPTSAFIPPISFESSTPPVTDKSTSPTEHDRPSTSGQKSYPPGSVQPFRPSTPDGHTFGVALDDVLARESTTLPLIIAQCVIAIDQFGLKTEGIYRVSGSASTVGKLKHMFDFEPERVDFRTPAGFFGDIHAVAGILKLYLRELPEPLLTKEFYQEFIRAARKFIGYKALIEAIEPAFHRRDAIHSLINDLPDSNYSCIRTLALHLHSIAENAEFNKMTVQNLASIFGPTLLGSEGSAIEAQIRVTETIITYALDMFELEDE